MGNAFEGLERIELFGSELVILISSGKKETLDKIMLEIESKHVVQYVYEKYSESVFLYLGERTIYNIERWEAEYSKFDYLTRNDIRRKFGIDNDDDGLLFLVSLTFEILRDEVIYK